MNTSRILNMKSASVKVSGNSSKSGKTASAPKGFGSNSASRGGKMASRSAFSGHKCEKSYGGFTKMNKFGTR